MPSPGPLEFSVVNNTSLILTALSVPDYQTNGLLLSANVVRLSQSDGTETIAPGSTVSITLPSGVGGVIIADANSLCPVAGSIIVLSVTPGKTLTLGTTQTDQMGHALDLVRNIMAAPTSVLAVGLVKAIQDAQAATDEAAADAILAAYFTSHPPFESVTTETYGMMLSWARTYAYLWALEADGSLGRSYNVQPSPYFGVNGASLGLIELAAPPSRGAVANPADTKSGLTITFTPTNGTARDLAFAGGTLSEAQTLTLMGTFSDPAWLAASGTTARLVPVFAGSLDTARVIAVPATGDTANETSDWSGLDVANLVIACIGLLSSFVTIFLGFHAFKAYVRNKRARGLNISNKDRALAQEAANRTIEGLREEFGEEFRGMDVRNRIRDDPVLLEEDMEVLRNSRADIALKVARAKGTVALDRAQVEVDELARLSDSPMLQSAQENIIESRESMETDLSASLERIPDITKGLKVEITSLGERISSDARQSFEESMEMVEIEGETATSLEREKSTEAKDGTEPAEEDVNPLEVVEIKAK